MCKQSGIVQDTEVGGKIKCSNHTLVRAYLKKARTNLVARKNANLEAIKAKKEEFKVTLENRFDVLDENDEDYIYRKKQFCHIHTGTFIAQPNCIWSRILVTLCFSTTLRTKLHPQKPGM